MTPFILLVRDGYPRINITFSLGYFSRNYRVNVGESLESRLRFVWSVIRVDYGSKSGKRRNGNTVVCLTPAGPSCLSSTSVSGRCHKRDTTTVWEVVLPYLLHAR